MKDEYSILYVLTTDDPEKQYSPLVLAQTAKMMDLTPRVYYLGSGLKILIPGTATKNTLGSYTSDVEIINNRLEIGIKILVIEATK